MAKTEKLCILDPWPNTAKDFAQLAQTKLTMPVLSLAGEKASAAILGPRKR